MLDPVAHTIAILGSLPDPGNDDVYTPAVVRIEKTALPASLAPTLLTQSLSNVQLIEHTSIVGLTQP